MNGFMSKYIKLYIMYCLCVNFKTMKLLKSMTIGLGPSIIHAMFSTPKEESVLALSICLQ